MKIKIDKGTLTDSDYEVVVTTIFEGEKKPAGATLMIDKACGGLITDLLEYGDFGGKLFQTAVLYTKGSIPSKRILILGLGKTGEFNTEKLRGAFSRAAQKIRELRIERFAISLLSLIHISEPTRPY